MEKKKIRWGKNADIFVSDCTTSDWSISDDCANVVYNQWLKKREKHLKWNIILFEYHWNLFLFSSSFLA